MAQEELKKEKKEEKKEAGKASKFVDFLGKILKLFENLPKAVVGIGVVVSLVAGGTGAWGTFVAPASKDVKELKQEVHDLKLWNEAQRQMLLSLLAGAGVECEQVEFEGFMLDMSTGEVEPLRSKK